MRLEIGMKVRVNGRKLTVAKIGELGFDFVGPRGGRVTAIVNVHDRNVLNLILGGMRPRLEVVSTIEKGW